MFIVRLGNEELGNIWHHNWFVAHAIFIEYGVCFVFVHFFGDIALLLCELQYLKKTHSLDRVSAILPRARRTEYDQTDTERSDYCSR